MGTYVSNPTALEILAIAPVVVVNFTTSSSSWPEPLLWFYVNWRGWLPTYDAIVRVVTLDLKVKTLTVHRVRATVEALCEWRHC